MLFSKNASERLVFVDLFVISRIPEYSSSQICKFATTQIPKKPNSRKAAEYHQKKMDIDQSTSIFIQ